MRATGIVRRIDELGRIVIPKEIRRTLRIREGDPLEIFTESDGCVIFRKYSHISELEGLAEKYAEALAANSGNTVLISDREKIVALSGGMAGGTRKEVLNKQISPELENFMERRKSLSMHSEEKGFVPILKDFPVNYSTEAISPIICDGDVMGAVIMASNKDKVKFGETENKLVSATAGILGKQMEM